MTKIYTDFLSAVDYQQQSILCNNILEIEPDLFWTDDRFIDEPMSEEEFEENEEEKNYYETYDSYLDSFEENRFQAYQFFITDCSESQAKWKHETFGLEYYYSEKLGCYIMPVYHLGTAWRLLPCEMSADFAEYHPEMVRELQHSYIKQ